MNSIRQALLEAEADSSITPQVPDEAVIEWLAHFTGLHQEWKQMEPRFHAAERVHQQHASCPPPAVNTAVRTWLLRQQQQKQVAAFQSSQEPPAGYQSEQHTPGALGMEASVRVQPGCPLSTSSFDRQNPLQQQPEFQNEVSLPSKYLTGPYKQTQPSAYVRLEDYKSHIEVADEFYFRLLRTFSDAGTRGKEQEEEAE